MSPLMDKTMGAVWRKMGEPRVQTFFGLMLISPPPPPPGLSLGRISSSDQRDRAGPLLEGARFPFYLYIKVGN